MSLRDLLLLAPVVLSLNSAGSEFDRPWANESTALVIDPYEGNSIEWDKVATDSRVVAIIHRATFGKGADSSYFIRKKQAKMRGYAWGSYHIGRAGDPITQANFYLETAQPESDEVMALDIEDLDPASSMTLDDARRFLLRIKEQTGRYPMLYANQAVAAEISRRYKKDDVFSQAPLWYARFRTHVSDFPVGTWNSYTLWQFKSELNCKQSDPSGCPYWVPGTKSDMDVDVYNGSIAELKNRWPFRSGEQH
jgi:lysozyme